MSNNTNEDPKTPTNEESTKEDTEMKKFIHHMDAFYRTTQLGKQLVNTILKVDSAEKDLNTLKAQNARIRDFQIRNSERLGRIREECDAKIERLAEEIRECDNEKRRLIVINVETNKLKKEKVQRGDKEFQFFTQESMKNYVSNKCVETYGNFDVLKIRKVTFMKDTERAKAFKASNPSHPSSNPNKVRLFVEFYDTESAKMLLRMSKDKEMNCFREAIPFHLRQKSRYIHNLVDKVNEELPDSTGFKYRVAFGSKIQVIKKEDNSQ